MVNTYSLLVAGLHGGGTRSHLVTVVLANSDSGPGGLSGAGGDLNHFDVWVKKREKKERKREREKRNFVKGKFYVKKGTHFCRPKKGTKNFFFEIF